ncbi:MAG TPA: ATP-dependent DNA ligase [Fimbriimonadaceae bacterium]|nr:ATP-dependent DNA ligase [Fimbriimonadaceae bacterium]
MRRFAALYAALDETNKTGGKVAALVEYFTSAPPADAAWALLFLIGRRPRRPVNTTKLWNWAHDVSGLPAWLFAECYDAVGDLAETIAAVVDFPDAGTSAEADKGLAHWVEHRLLALAQMEEEDQRIEVIQAWRDLDRQGRFVFTKMITGEMRIGVSQDLVLRALAQVSGLPTATIAHRLMGHWSPTAEFFQSVLSPDSSDADVSRPYPFCLAHPLEGDPEKLGEPSEWLAEWKWDGIRAQLVRRQGKTFVWSRGEELVSERFPETAMIGECVPDGTVIDGEIMAWRGDHPLPFAELQKRIGRKIVGKKLLVDVPVVLVAYDLLEWDGQDVRSHPLASRREALERLVNGAADSAIRLSAQVPFDSWQELAERRAESRALNVEGLMLKRLDSPYLVGRKKGYWWKWKIEPYSIDCVLIYAQRGNGKRASLYTDYTFGVWDEGRLVPFAKAYSGLTDEEIRRVDAWVRRNTLEKFGPVRTVKPELVFELAFEGIQLSSRHKSGIAVRFPRMARWRHDKKPEDADSLESVKALLRVEG